MEKIVCFRCKDEKPKMNKAPLLGAMGEQIYQEICAECFSEWKAMELKYINEYRLNMMEKEHRQFLTKQMKIFLGYEKDDENAAVPS